jgi:hypothetical protein
VSETVTIVSGLRGAELRVVVRVTELDDDWVFVAGEQGVRRFSRATGFEHTEGGGWSTWRLAGTDYRRLKKGG